VILTKDNLVKSNWHESINCVFYHHEKSTKQLLFKCKFSTSIWSVIQVGSTLYVTLSVANIFVNILKGVDQRISMSIVLGNGLNLLYGLFVFLALCKLMYSLVVLML
jgi:hypothetical protein